MQGNALSLRSPLPAPVQHIISHIQHTLSYIARECVVYLVTINTFLSFGLSSSDGLVLCRYNSEQHKCTIYRRITIYYRLLEKSST